MKDSEIEYWFTTPSGAHIPVRNGQTKEQAIEELKGKQDRISQAERIYNDDLPSAPPNIKLSKQEYGALRAEVMRKNVAQRGKVKPINFAFTANNFYVYTTKGDDDYKPIAKFDIELEREEIKEAISLINGETKR